MSDTTQAARYQGKGHRQAQEAWRNFPEVYKEAIQDPAGYLASPDLAAAVDVAATLGMPLLLTGEPGSGKSRLADSVAWEMGMGEPLRFVVKSDTQAQELFYRYDLVGRYNASRDRNTDERQLASRFLYLGALGKALLYARGGDLAREVLGLDETQIEEQLPDYAGSPRRSVVLIDEIDKAPRDVPNDLLAEIEEGGFHIPELEVARQREVRIALPKSGAANGEVRLEPLVIITSNSERALPEAFLRRCIYFHVPFPPFDDDAKDGEAKPADRPVTVERIVERRFYDRYREEHRYQGRHDGLVHDAISLFKFIRRDSRPDRAPSLAELLNWLDYLLRQVTTPGRGLRELAPVLLSLSVRCLLLKQKDDQEQADRMIADWQRQ
ncbi:AAA family ATPase [Candidatus Thiosymbion oneisti]|uniref:AAA family ATPase n=1 Tax=Candidatus Thiosymbion oneisti TaxID=589554 RepID=UPI00159EFF58|nr:MoxR family ATPase [Candidatus Thiosymbion oneisti]